jgi:GxxExxY protein
MNNNLDNLLYRDLTHEIIGAAMEVHKELGPGFSEVIYHKALLLEFNLRDIKFETEKKIDVCYKGEIVGDYFIDLLADEKVIIELKAVDLLSRIHEAQLISYLKATNCKIGLLINFGQKSLEYKRIKLKDTLVSGFGSDQTIGQRIKRI